MPATGVGKALMVASVLLVLVVELLNSAVEATVDRISLENHQLAKRAKDIGSAAVFVSLVGMSWWSGDWYCSVDRPRASPRGRGEADCRGRRVDDVLCRRCALQLGEAAT